MDILNSILNIYSLNSYEIDCQVWYKAVDIGEALGYAKARKGIYKLMSAHKTEFYNYCCKIPKVVVNPVTGKKYTANLRTYLINVKRIKRILMYSDKPKAKEYRQAVTKDLAE
ncbi:MAG: hypothetical protein APF84_17195 [Gracilibacter sp. BRH_c7a]|nr:MAG: hypothetical protein APF84_17195 [Gracilibacter sp. BRH_c7a]